MRRVRWVRIALDDHGGAVCHVEGTGHRLPTVRRVPLATALSLAAEGVPCLVRAALRSASRSASGSESGSASARPRTGSPRG